MVRLHPGSLTGLLVQWEDAGLAHRKSGFDSPAVHCLEGSSSNGKIPAWRAGDPGSTPGESTAKEGSRIRLAGLLWKGSSPQGDEGSTPLPSALTPMVKGTSSLASNEQFQVRILVGVLMVVVV